MTDITTSATDQANPTGVTATDHSAFTSQTAQPTGDGGTAATTQNSPLAKYWEGAPADHLPSVQQALKAMEADTTRRFQDHAEFRKTWEPYGELGLTDIPPEDLSSYLGLVERLLDETTGPDVVRELAAHYQLGINDPVPGGVSDEDDEHAELRAQIRSEVLAELEPRLKPVEEFTQGELTQRQQQQQEQKIEGVIAAINQERGENRHLDETERQEVLLAALALHHSTGLPEDEAVRQGYEQWKQQVSRIEQGLVKAKTAEPAPFERGGQRSGDSPKPGSWEQARNSLKERLAAEARVAS